MAFIVDRRPPVSPQKLRQSSAIAGRVGGSMAGAISPSSRTRVMLHGVGRHFPAEAFAALSPPRQSRSMARFLHHSVFIPSEHPPEAHAVCQKLFKRPRSFKICRLYHIAAPCSEMRLRRRSNSAPIPACSRTLRPSCAAVSERTKKSYQNITLLLLSHRMRQTLCLTRSAFVLRFCIFCILMH